MSTQSNRIAANSFARPSRSRIRRLIGQSLLLFVVGILLTLLVQVLGTASSHRSALAFDGNEPPAKKEGSVFREKPALIWLERSIAECEKSLDAQVPDDNQTCQTHCDKAVPATAEARKLVGEERYARILAELEPRYSEVIEISGTTAPQPAADFKGPENTESLVAVRGALKELGTQLKDLGELSQSLEQKKARVEKTPGAKSEEKSKEGAELDTVKSQLERASGQYHRARSDYETLKAKEETLKNRLKTLLTQRHLHDEYDKAFSKGGKPVDQSAKGYTLTELAIMAGDRKKIDGLLQLESQTGIASLKQRLIDAIVDQNFPLAAEVISIGADVSQSPGAYSALALSSTFGQRDISTMLVNNGAWIATPWTIYDVAPDTRRIALQHQLQRIDAFSREIREPHPATAQKIQRLKCRLQCAAAARSTAARSGE